MVWISMLTHDLPLPEEPKSEACGFRSYGMYMPIEDKVDTKRRLYCSLGEGHPPPHLACGFSQVIAVWCEAPDDDTGKLDVNEIK